MRFNLFLFIISIVIVFSCAVNKSLKTQQAPIPPVSDVLYLPGIDSTVARNAIEFSNRIMVDYNRRILADEWYEKARDSFQIADSIWTFSHIKNGQDSAQLRIYKNWQSRHGFNSSNGNKLNESKFNFPDEICLKILDTAWKEAHQARVFNPYDLDIRSLLTKIYMKQGELSHNSICYTSALEELNNLLLADKSNPYIYEKLAECYYALKDWASCYQYFHKAEEVLLIISAFKYDNLQALNSAIDTVRWVYYLRGQGEAKAKLYDSDQAMHYLQKASELSSSDTTKQELQDYVQWIKWDNGNIRAAEIKDDILKSEPLGDYRKVRAKYLDLLEVLTTQPAKNEINWKIASIEFNFLKRKEDALERLFRVVQNVHEMAQTQTLNEVYLKDYAAMCYSVGIDYYNEYKFRLAYIYLNQASQFDWDHRSDCYFQLAILSQANPTETIRNCKKALESFDQLSKENIKKIHKMLAVSYMRMGEFEIAQSYYQSLTTTEPAMRN